VAGAAAEIPVGPGLNLLDHPVALLERVRIREVIRWGDDLLVGFDGTRGAWLGSTGMRPPAKTIVFADPQHPVRGHLLILHGAHDRRALRLLDAWRDETDSLVVVLSSDGTFALAETATREALLGESTIVSSREPPGSQASASAQSPP
jgi:hypothetical protein